jgi:hypothetical protein
MTTIPPAQPIRKIPELGVVGSCYVAKRYFAE